MGGSIRRIINRVVDTATNPFVKVGGKVISELTGSPSQAQIEAQRRRAAEEQRRKAAEEKRKREAAVKAQQAVQTGDAPGVNPGEVVYAGEEGQESKKRKKRRSGTIMTSTTGVIGDAPTEKKTLLGG